MRSEISSSGLIQLHADVLVQGALRIPSHIQLGVSSSKEQYHRNNPFCVPFGAETCAPLACELFLSTMCIGTMRHTFDIEYIAMYYVDCL